MNPWLLSLALLFVVLCAAVRLIKPVSPELSDFERARRQKLGDEKARLEARRIAAAPVLMSVRRTLSIMMLLGVLCTLTAVIGLVWAVVMVCALTVIGGFCERDFRLARRLYRKLEPKLLALAELKYVAFIPTGGAARHDVEVGSTEELLHVVAHASFLDSHERGLFKAALEFPHLRAGDVMRPRRSLRSVDKGEVLGPLVIDELYKTGESVFLVTDEGLDNVVGLLPLDKLTGLELTGSPNALKAMDDTVEFISEDTPIVDALRLLRESGSEMLIVRDSENRTVGGVSLGEITDRLFG